MYKLLFVWCPFIHGNLALLSAVKDWPPISHHLNYDLPIVTMGLTFHQCPFTCSSVCPWAHISFLYSMAVLDAAVAELQEKVCQVSACVVFRIEQDFRGFFFSRRTHTSARSVGKECSRIHWHLLYLGNLFSLFICLLWGSYFHYTCLCHNYGHKHTTSFQIMVWGRIYEIWRSVFSELLSGLTIL